jgi:hypothetical protein
LREDANNQLYGGWPMILSGLKTLLETGETLTTLGSLRWGQAEGASARGQVVKERRLLCARLSNRAATVAERFCYRLVKA